MFEKWTLYFVSTCMLTFVCLPPYWIYVSTLPVTLLCVQPPSPCVCPPSSFGVSTLLIWCVHPPCVCQPSPFVCQPSPCKCTSTLSIWCVHPPNVCVYPCLVCPSSLCVCQLHIWCVHPPHVCVNPSHLCVHLPHLFVHPSHLCVFTVLVWLLSKSRPEKTQNSVLYIYIFVQSIYFETKCFMSCVNT